MKVVIFDNETETDTRKYHDTETFTTHRTMKKVTEDWTALEDEEDSEESYEEVTDNENFSEQEIFELY